MKKLIILFILVCAVSGVKAQVKERLSFATTVGMAIAASTPESTPFEWQVLGYYHFNDRLSGGFGTGLSFYEKILFPVFANVKWTVVRARLFTPYLECGIGYSFALDKNSNGGFYINPSIGVQYSIGGKKKLSFVIGYEQQKLECLKTHENQYFKAEFKERLRHGGISFKVGFLF